MPSAAADAAAPSVMADRRLAVVIVTHDTCDEVLGCLDSLAAGAHLRADLGAGAAAASDHGADSGVDLDVVVVDSGSQDGTHDVVARRHPGVRVLSLANVGFGRGANAGIRATTAEHVVVCNADVRFGPGALTSLAGCLDADPDLAAVGPLVRYPDGTVQASARCIPDTRTAIAHALLGRIAPDNRATRRYHDRDLPCDRPRDVDWLSGCALALRRAAVEPIGGFDPGYFLYVEDVDLGQRLRAAGWRLRYEPAACVTHRVGASTSRRRVRALIAHARSLDRYQSARLHGPWRTLARVPLRIALMGWVVATWSIERCLRNARSVTGERRSVVPAAGDGHLGSS